MELLFQSEFSWLNFETKFFSTSKAVQKFNDLRNCREILLNNNLPHHAKYQSSRNIFETQQRIQKHLVTFIKNEVYHCTLVKLSQASIFLPLRTFFLEFSFQPLFLKQNAWQKRKTPAKTLNFRSSFKFYNFYRKLINFK